MMEGLDFKKQEAMKYMGGDRVKSTATLEGIIKLLFSPPGAKRKYYPSLKWCRKYKDILNQIQGVFIDAGKVYSNDILSFAVGDTELYLSCESPSFLVNTIGMYGANVKIIASNNAVVKAFDKDAHFEVESDESCIISIEKL